MSLAITIFFSVGWIVSALLFFVSWRFYRKAAVYDEILQYIADDVNTNLKQFAKMSVSPVLSSDTEIQEAHRNMMTMGKRFGEILLRMEEASGLRLRPPPPPPRPKVL